LPTLHYSCRCADEPVDQRTSRRCLRYPRRLWCCGEKGGDITTANSDNPGRHGARLDEANVSWAETAPADYDTPLTYGGWKDAQRFGSQLAENPALQLSLDSNAHPPLPPRRKRIVVHSSPYLRCIQTAVGVCAGLATKLSYSDSPMPTKSRLGENKTRGKDHDLINLVDEAPLLRVDAFLGEVLQPSSFHHARPPISPMMLAAAKGALLHEDPIESFTPANQGNFPGGWESPHGRRTRDENHRMPLFAADSKSLDLALMGDMNYRSQLADLIHRNRSNSQSRAQEAARGPNVGDSTSIFVASPGCYDPPVPTYSVSMDCPIPKGYVSHARTHCVDVDREWDSTKAAVQWGDGGTFEESDAQFYHRIQTGLRSLLDWYSKQPVGDHGDGTWEHDNDEGHYDLVVIIVTHNKGCSALYDILDVRTTRSLISFPTTGIALAKRTQNQLRRETAPLHDQYSVKTINFADPTEQNQLPSSVVDGLLQAGSLTTVAHARRDSMARRQPRKSSTVPQPSSSPSLGLWSPHVSTRPKNSSLWGGGGEAAAHRSSSRVSSTGERSREPSPSRHHLEGLFKPKRRWTTMGDN